MPKRDYSKFPGYMFKEYPEHTHDENKPLTDKQKKYVEYHVTHGLSPKAAARMAGYPESRSNPYSLEKSANVAKAVRVAQEQSEKASMMTKKKVMDGFIESIEMAKVKGDPFVMIAGWREVAKMCGYYEPIKHKIEIDARGQVIVQKLQTLSDAQLLSLAHGESEHIIDGEIISDDSKQEDPSPPRTSPEGTGET